MQIAHVLGSAVATTKHSSMVGWRLLIVQMVNAEGQGDGEPQLVVDAIGARAGDRVLVTSDGASARKLMNAKNSPARWTVMGICDA